MDPWAIVAVVLLAVLVGAALPVLIQLYTALRAVRQAVDRLERRLEPVLRDVDGTAKSLSRIGASLERHTDDIEIVVRGAADLAEVARELRSSLKTAAIVGGMLGPVLAAAIRAWTDGPDGRPERAEPATDTERGGVEPERRTEPRRAASG